MMNRFSLLFLILVATFLPAEAFAHDKLLFSMAGPRDASIPDFTITTGEISKTSQFFDMDKTTIFVTRAAYAEISARISRIGLSKMTGDIQVFAVTAFNGSTRVSTSFIRDKAVGDVMHIIVLMCETNHQPVPGLVSKLEESFSGS